LNSRWVDDVAEAVAAVGLGLVLVLVVLVVTEAVVVTFEMVAVVHDEGVAFWSGML
jgi:hypothetical protein